MTTRFELFLPLLVNAGVEFIVIGGFAGTLHGAARVTLDLDLVHARHPENLALLAATLAPLHPYLRGAPPGLPFTLDAHTLRRGLNFTLRTDWGSLDLLGEIAVGRGYVELLPETVEMMAFDVGVRCLNLDKLIEVKSAVGRAKDFDAVAELCVIREERRNRSKV